MRRIGALVSALALVVGVAVAGAPSAIADPAPDPYAFSSADVGFIDGSDEAGRVGRLREMDEYVGVKKPIIRLDLFWSRVQPCRTCEPRWDHLDPIVDAAHAQGIRVLLILDYGVDWANGGKAGNHFPTDDAAWAAIVDAAVAHFGDKVQAYEVWNEPNNATFGSYGNNSLDVRARRYWELTRIAYERVHAACARCVVLAGASGGGDSHGDEATEIFNDNEAVDWLAWAYRHGMAAHFDALTFHPYPDIGGGHPPSYAKSPCYSPANDDKRWYPFWSGFGPDDPACGGLARLHDLMARNGDGHKKIWGTEFGYATTGSRTPQPRERVRDALEEGVRMWRSRSYTGPLFIYSFQDTERSFELCRKNPADMECNFGLRDADGRPKEPIYTDLRAALIGDDWQASLSPGRSLFRGSALRSPDGRFHLWLQADGNLVLYQGGTVRWKVDTRRAYRLSNRPNGDLVLYDHAERALWSTKTAGKGDSTLWLQEDGNLVLYAHRPAATATWASNTVR